MTINLRQTISFVIPCYRSANTIRSVVDEIRAAMETETNYTYEIILVNDYSPDGVWDVILQMVKEDDRITGVNLAKNFGQHAALMAGYSYSVGDIVVSLDDDGQTPADDVMKLINKINEGYDVVYAAYNRNMESAFRRFGSQINSMMAECMIGKPKGIAIQSYYAAKRFVIDEMLKYDHAYPYTFGLVFRTTQNITNVEIDHRSRETGSSGYTLSKLISLWMNGFTAFSVKPLRIATILGVICSMFGFSLGLYFVIDKLVNPHVPLGYSSIISAVVFFGGLILLTLGMIGEYIGRIYICLNHAPQFVVKRTTLEDNRGKAINKVSSDN